MQPTTKRSIWTAAVAAVSCVATCGLFIALGPLNPPAGAVTGTSRTLQEIYDKIPSATSSQGWTPLAASTTGRAITSPGKYIVTGDISSTSIALEIAADNVIVDLNGFTLTTNNATAAYGILFNGTRRNVTIRNGTITNNWIGIGAGSALTNITLEDLTINASRLEGVYLLADANKHILVQRVRVLDTGISSTATDNFTTVNGIYIAGGHIRVEDCSVQRVAWNGIGNPAISGIRLPTSQFSGGVGHIIDHCSVTLDVSTTGSGMWSNGAGLYRDNFSQGFTTPYNMALTSGGGNF